MSTKFWSRCPRKRHRSRHESRGNCASEAGRLVEAVLPQRKQIAEECRGGVRDSRRCRGPDAMPGTESGPAPHPGRSWDSAARMPIRRGCRPLAGRWGHDGGLGHAPSEGVPRRATVFRDCGRQGITVHPHRGQVDRRRIAGRIDGRESAPRSSSPSTRLCGKLT